MNQWIRWKGIIPFVLITTAIVLFFLLAVDSLAKGLIESTGSKLVGAKVETKNVDLHLSPLGITVNGLQVANPEHPMSNVVEIKRIRFDLAGDKLLLGKVIIEQMDLDQVRFDTPRTSSGAISKPQTRSVSTAKTDTKATTGSTEKSNNEEQQKGMSMPSLDLPDVNEILAREPLDTQRQADAISASISKTGQDWKLLQQSLPDQTRQDSYQKRLSALAKTRQDDIRQVAVALKELDAIQQDLKADVGKINTARKQVQSGLAKLDMNYKALLKAPAADKQRLLKKYSPDAQGVGNLSALLFGNQAGDYVQQGLYWYQKLAPMLTGDAQDEEPKAERQKGQEIRFREHQPSPDFLIRRIHSSVVTEKGNFEGQILDVTHQPEIIGKPVSFEFNGQQMSGMESLRIHGKLDHIDREKSLDQIDMEIKAYKVSRHSLSSDPNLQLLITSARSNTRMQATSRNGQLDSQMNIHMDKIEYDNRAGSDEFQQVLVSAFNSVEDFNIDASLRGSLKKPALTIRSDLDRRLNKQISVAFDRRINAYKQELNRQLQQLTDAQIAPVEKSIASLRNEVDTELQATEAKYQQQAASLEQQKRQYQSWIETEKRKAESAARKQLENKAKSLLNNLRGK